jgi:hypothetical protein
LKLYDLKNIRDQERNGNDTVVDHKLGKWFRHRTDERKSVAVRNVTRDVEGSGKSPCRHANDEEAPEIDLVKILGIKEQVRYSHVFAEIATDHGKENEPAKHQHQVPLKIVQQKLNRKRVDDLWI